MTTAVTDERLGEFARKQHDWFERVRKGSLDPDEVEKVVQRIIDRGKNGSGVFSRNQHGHILLSITGIDLTGAEEIHHLTNEGFRVNAYAKSCFQKVEYDKNHRLVKGKQYTIALMPIKEIEVRTTDALRRRGIEKYGYGKPLAGFIPRLRETVSDEQMEEMGFWYIVAPHDPIKDSGGDPLVLGASRDDGGRWVGADWGHPGSQWSGRGAFAFPVSASSRDLDS